MCAHLNQKSRSHKHPKPQSTKTLKHLNQKSFNPQSTKPADLLREEPKETVPARSTTAERKSRRDELEAKARMRGLGFRVSDLGFVGLGPRDFAGFRGFRRRLSRGLGALSALACFGVQEREKLRLRLGWGFPATEFRMENSSKGWKSSRTQTLKQLPGRGDHVCSRRSLRRC